MALGNRVKAALNQGDTARAVQLYEQRIAHYRHLDDAYHLVRVLYGIGYVYMSMERYADAMQHTEQGLEIARQTGDRIGTVGALRVQSGHTLFIAGDYRAAHDQYQEVVDILLDMDIRGTAASALARVALIAFVTGDRDTARTQFEQALKVAVDVNFPVGIASVNSYLGLLNMTEGNYVEAEEQLQTALKLTSNISKTDPAKLGLAVVAYSRGDMEAAREYLLSTWTLRTRYETASRIWTVPMLAMLVADRGQLGAAAGLLASGRMHPACPKAWWDTWPLLQKFENRLESELSSAALAAAQADANKSDLSASILKYVQELQ